MTTKQSAFFLMLGKDRYEFFPTENPTHQLNLVKKHNTPIPSKKIIEKNIDAIKKEIGEFEITKFKNKLVLKNHTTWVAYKTN